MKSVTGWRRVTDQGQDPEGKGEGEDEWGDSRRGHGHDEDGHESARAMSCMLSVLRRATCRSRCRGGVTYQVMMKYARAKGRMIGEVAA